MKTIKHYTKNKSLTSKPLGKIKPAPQKKRGVFLEADPSRRKRQRTLRRVRFQLRSQQPRRSVLPVSTRYFSLVQTVTKRLQHRCNANERIARRYAAIIRLKKGFRQYIKYQLLASKYRIKLTQIFQPSLFVAALPFKQYPRKKVRLLRRPPRFRARRVRAITSAALYSNMLAARVRPFLAQRRAAFRTPVRKGRKVIKWLQAARKSIKNIENKNEASAIPRLEWREDTITELLRQQAPGTLRRSKEKAFRNTLSREQRKKWWRQRRATKRALDRARWLARGTRPKVALWGRARRLSTRPTRALALRYFVAARFRWKRPHAERIVVTRRQRWWLKKYNKQLRWRVQVKFQRRRVPHKGRISRLRWQQKTRFLFRRYRQGKRFYAGKFGRKRWRTERRDRLFVKRMRRVHPLHRVVVQQTAANALRRRTAFKRWSSSSRRALPLRGVTATVCSTTRVCSNLTLNSRIQRKVVPRLTHLQSYSVPRGLHRTLLVNTRSKLIAKQLRRRPHANSLLRIERRILLQRSLQLMQKNKKQTRLTLLETQRHLASSRFIPVRPRTTSSVVTPVTASFSAPVKTVRNSGVVAYSKLRSNITPRVEPRAILTERLTSVRVGFLLSKRGMRRRKQLHRSFLRNSSKRVDSLLGVPAPAAQATWSLLQQHFRYKELRFYRRSPAIRLPNTEITRRRRRKAGRVLFSRNTLKQPQTLRGLRNLLLPPATAYGSVTNNYAATHTRAARANLEPLVQPEDEYPLFWRRPHTRANIKAINSLRRRQYAKHKRRYKRRQVLRFRRRALRVSIDRKEAASKPHAMLKIASTLLGQELSARAALVASWRTRSARLRRTAYRATPALSRTIEYDTVVPQKVVPSLQKLHGLWQLRSVKAMRSAERTLSAWSPQLSNRNRRAHFPRVKGVPVPRKWPSFRTKRARRQLNAKLLARNLPQRRYTDYAPIKLQYYYGSVGSTGYARFRRVHRAKSVHNRWWRPNKFAVPFAHPFSRRALNSKRYLRAAFIQAGAPKMKSFARLLRNRRAVYLHPKFPPRVIPWRNFRFRRPRFGRVPKVLQRWTFVKRNGKTGRVSPRKESVILHRSARELRAIERYTFQRNVWKDRRWAFLDKSTGVHTKESCVLSVVRAIPVTAWSALQRRVGSPAVYAKMQRQILEEFRRWVLKEQQSYTQPTKLKLRRAQLFLINLITSALKSGARFVDLATHREKWHHIARGQAFNKRASIKALRFLRLRTLPQLDAHRASTNILQRERSGLYRRWLQGVEGVIKRSRTGYVATSRSRYTANVALLFGRRRARFPAAGRRRKSFDSLLHAFAKKIGPAHLRRAASLRFIRALPPVAYDFRENLLTTAASRGLNRRRKLSRELFHLRYLSTSWRELLARRVPVNGAQAQYRITQSKRRFLALPLTLVNAKRNTDAAAALTHSKQQMRAIRVGILRRALRRRREERSFIDLRHSALQRRLPKEQASRPWKLKRAKKRRQAVKIGPYSHFTVSKRPAIPGRWTLVHLSAVGPQREQMALTPVTSMLPSGEQLTRLAGKLRKDRRALRGFVLKVNAPKRRKLRRKNRDSCKRRRVSRRSRRSARLAVIRNTRHWSEKKDRDLRVAAFIHKRFRYTKKVSASLRGKSRLRYSGGSLQSKQGVHFAAARLARFVARQRRVGSMQQDVTSCALLPTTRRLVTRSFFRRRSVVKHVGRSKLKDLRRRMYSRLSARLRTCGRLRSDWRLRRRTIIMAKAKANQTQSTQISAKLLATVDVASPVTSLWFQKPTTRVVKSQIRKENDALADIAAKEDRYKLTAQYVESLTAFIPELMNYLLSKKIKKASHQITYKTARHLVRNIYWSLRVYLNVDPFDFRFIARDKTPAARLRLFENISDLSESQRTEQPQRAILRYRFQPSKVLRAPNTMRFRGDWLRAFFPAKHALYQENPEDYGKFLFKTRRIRRLRIGPKGIATWINEKQRLSHETRARQLLTLRFSRTRRRFETVLQTTRRLPQAESTTFLSSTARTSFFNRSASTYTNRGLAITTRWIHRQKRFIALEEGWRVVSPVTAVLARNRALPVIEARSRTNYITTTWAAASSSLLDSRFVRTKSARSRQYLIRSSRQFTRLSKQATRANIVFYRNLLAKRTPVTARKRRRWTCITRRSHAMALGGWLAKRRTVLCTLRTRYRARRGRTNHRTLGPSFAQKLRKSHGRLVKVAYPNDRVLSTAPILATSTFKGLRLAARRLHRYKRSALNRVAAYRSTLGPHGLQRASGSLRRSICLRRGKFHRPTPLPASSFIRQKPISKKVDSYMVSLRQAKRGSAKGDDRDAFAVYPLNQTARTQDGARKIFYESRQKLFRTRRQRRVLCSALRRFNRRVKKTFKWLKTGLGSRRSWSRFSVIRRRRFRQFTRAFTRNTLRRKLLLAQCKMFSIDSNFLRAKHSLFSARSRRNNFIAAQEELEMINRDIQNDYPYAEDLHAAEINPYNLELWEAQLSRKKRPAFLLPRGKLLSKYLSDRAATRQLRRDTGKIARTTQYIRSRKAQVRLHRRKRKVFLLPSKLIERRALRSAAATAAPVRRMNVVNTPYFKDIVGRTLVQSTALTGACALYTKFNQQAPFEVHRPRLWNNLTQRWMKKYRIGRYWLRDTVRWLRDPWLSEIVACDVSVRPDRFGGQLRSRAQQVGEYVPDVDASGRNVRRKNALRERHKFQKILPKVNDPEIKKTNKILKQKPLTDRLLARQRLKIAKQALRKPMPTLRLANYEYRDVIREHKANKAKSVKQKQEEEQQRVQAYWSRKAKKLPPLRPKRLPLKHPANLWLPHIIWKEIQRRIRKFEWRESDEVFFRKGFRNAFRFHPNEKRKSPWLEHLMYTRATYSTRLGEFRRRQYPHEQKKFKWLQRVRKMLYPGRGTRYIKWRKWPQLRRYNQNLHYTLFNLRDRGAARRHFKRLSGRTRPPVSAFVSMSKGLTDRLDLTCFQMGVAPSMYWARIVTEFGLLRVNGVTVYNPTYRIKPSDIIYPNWNTIARFQHYFKPQLRAREEYQRRNRASTSFYPTNMEYHRGIRAFVYKHAPDTSDLRRSSRIRPAYFRWFRLDSAM